MKRFNKLGAIGRFKPLHLGADQLLEAICNNAEHAIIGIGSCNKYNVRNPFTAQETAGMIDAYLAPRHSNYEFKFIPDYGDGQRWKQEIKDQFGCLDGFVSGDEYVVQLLNKDYKMILPSEIIPKEQFVFMRGSIVRVEMAKGDGWKKYVPQEVAQYLAKNCLLDRFRTDFGAETLDLASKGESYIQHEDYLTERLHTMEA